MITPGFISGVHNYHKVGVNGYIVRNRISPQEGMIRAVHCTGDGLHTLLYPNGDFMFAPHNHRQDVTLYKLLGHALNVNLRFDESKGRSGDGGHQYVFDSELIDGRMGTHWRTCGDLDIVDVQPISEEGIRLESQTIHTLVAEENSAWLIVEGELATVKYPRHVNHCYSNRHDFSLETTEDLYLPMGEGFLEHQWFKFGDKIKAILTNLFMFPEAGV